MAYEVLKHLNWTNKDTIEINNIEDQKWIKNYKNLWYTNSPQNDNDEQETTSTPSAGIDEISVRNSNRAWNLWKIEKQLDQMD